MPAPEKLAELRRLLATRFPTEPRPAGRVLGTGIPALDAATGGLPLGALTEVVCAAPSCGGHLLLGQLLATTRRARLRVALIDGTNSFDPSSFAPDLLAHLVWVRCGTAECPPGPPPTTSPPPLSGRNRPESSATATALQAADLLVRDANLGLAILSAATLSFLGVGMP
ncbi:MAG: hypothetical protein HZC55_25110, partial [Verrucomicrobia bacterium]|nr:hypothetical protein [Verrucomicrobiota bacterium]